MRKIVTLMVTLVALMALSSVAYADDDNDNGLHFRAILSGAEEVPTPVDTETSGKARFSVNKEQTEIDFVLNIEDATDILGAAGAHIHCAPAGENGPVVVFLAGAVPGGFGGDVKIQGTLTEANIVDDTCGATFAELIESMQNGDAYVNVHSATNPSGEVRGQIEANKDDDDEDEGDDEDEQDEQEEQDEEDDEQENNGQQNDDEEDEDDEEDSQSTAEQDTALSGLQIGDQISHVHLPFLTR